MSECTTARIVSGWGSKSWRTGNVIKIKSKGREGWHADRQSIQLSWGKGGKISFWISEGEEERGSIYYADPTEEEGGSILWPKEIPLQTWANSLTYCGLPLE